MAGSGAHNIDNFTPQTMDRHQMIMNTEVMKHISIMNSSSVREIMLQHERTFKEQVHDLHKLYEVQRSLMHKAKYREADFHQGISQACCNHDQARGKFCEGMPMVGGDKAGPTYQHLDFANPTREEKLNKNTVGPTRKKVIDLEQLPEDDTDDEMEGSDIGSGTTMTKPIPSGYLNGFGSGMSSNPVNAIQLPRVTGGITHLANVPNSGTLLSSSLYIDCKEGSNLPLPVVEPTSVISIQNCIPSSVPFEKPNTNCTSVKSPQNATNWLFQGNNRNTEPVSSTERLIQHQAKPSSDLVMQEALLKGYHQQSEGFPVVRNLGSKTLPTEDSLHVRSWTKSTEETKSTPAAQDSFPSVLGTMERPSTVLTVEGYNMQGGQYTELEMNSSEGRHVVSNFMSPSISVLSNKGQINEENTNLWYAQNPVLQISQYQQKVAYGPQSFQSNVNQSTWLQSSQNTHANLYGQQMVYATQVPDTSRIGFRMEGLQINQGDVSGLSPKPPFEKPPKLVLKNIGSVSEAEATKKTTEQCLDNSKRMLKVKDVKHVVKGEAKEVSVTHEGDQRDLQLQCGTTVLCSEKLPVPKLQVSNAEEFNAPTSPSESVKDSKPANHGLAMTSTGRPGTFSDVNTQGCLEDEQNFHVSSSSINKSEIQCAVLATDNLTMVESTIHQQEENKDTYDRESSLQTVAKINEDKNTLSLSGEGSSLIPGKDDVEGSVSGCNNKPRDQKDNEHVQISRRSEDAKSPHISTSTHNGSDNVNATGQSNSPDTASPISHVEEDSDEAEHVYNRNLCQGFVVPKGDNVIPSTSDRSSRKHDSHGKRSLLINAGGQPSDVGTASSQVTVQAVSMQSTSTECGVVKHEKECSSKEMGKNVVDKIHGKGPNSLVRKRTSTAVGSEGPSTSLPSSMFSGRQAKSEILDFDIDEQISDTENFAAAILLSFAPKTNIQNAKKHVKEDTAKIANNVRKRRTPENVSSSSRQRGAGLIDRVRDNEYEDAGTANCLQSESKTQPEKIDHIDSVRYPSKDRYREENSLFLADSGAKPTVKSTRSKVLRVVSVCNSVGDDPNDCSKSKQLDKIGAGYSSIKSVDAHDHHPIPYKSKDTFHTPTGRRSSRVPSMTGRGQHDSPLQQQTLHYHDAGGHADINSRKRIESSGISGKLENGIKNKPWNDINKKRNRIRSQTNDIVYKKVQR